MADKQILGGYYKAQREEAKKQREIRDIIRERRLREATGELSEEEEQAYREAVESRAFGTYPVTVLPHDPDYYGKGPSKSTRVASHKFVPGQRVAVSTGLGESLSAPQINSGTVYVRFARPSKQQPSVVVYKYTNVPVAVYESFRNSNSKGRFINNPLDTHNPTMVEPSSEEFTRYCQDL